MIFATALATGLFTAMLRSALAVIAVAAMIGIVFLAAFIFSGAGLFSLFMSILGFNAGLITFGVGFLVLSGNPTA